MRSLALLPLLVACAGPPDVPLCAARPGVLFEPTYLRVGNDDLLSASLSYTGCEADFFQVCAPDDVWLDRTEARLELWHDEAIAACDEQNLVDAAVSLRGVRQAYEDLFDTDHAQLTLIVGGVPVDYHFGPTED